MQKENLNPYFAAISGGILMFLAPGYNNNNAPVKEGKMDHLDKQY